MDLWTPGITKMSGLTGILLLISAVLGVVLQIRYATKDRDVQGHWRIYLLLSGFVFGFLAAIFFASNQMLKGDVLMVACFVGAFAAFGFGWLVPAKTQRIYRRLTSINDPDTEN